MSVSGKPPAGQWQTVPIGDVEIGFVDRGNGAPIVLVHAGVFSEWFRDVAASRALEDFRVIRLRRAGYGRTPPARHLAIADHAQHAAAVADRLGLDRIHFVGHSSSCQIGLALALQRPELLESLVLLEPAAAGGFFRMRKSPSFRMSATRCPSRTRTRSLRQLRRSCGAMGLRDPELRPHQNRRDDPPVVEGLDSRALPQIVDGAPLRCGGPCGTSLLPR